MNKYSLCCICNALKDKKVSAKTITKTAYLKLPKATRNKTLADLALHNIRVTKQTLKFCEDNNLNYRISSSLIPLESLPEANFVLEESYNWVEIQSEFELCKQIIKRANIRCSTHPDQFVVPASMNQAVVKKAMFELNLHGKLMDLFGLSSDYHSPINIHMNCYKGSTLKDTASRFCETFDVLNDNVKSRLVLENEDKPNSWDVLELYDNIYKKIQIPITYDSHHFRLNNKKGLEPQEAFDLAKSTWGKHTPLFHFSNGKLSKTDKAHSSFVYDVHTELFDGSTDIEFEFKEKDVAIIKFRKEFGM